MREIRHRFYIKGMHVVSALGYEVVIHYWFRLSLYNYVTNGYIFVITYIRNLFTIFGVYSITLLVRRCKPLWITGKDADRSSAWRGG